MLRRRATTPHPPPTPRPKEYDGIEESIAHLQRYMLEHGPFDGVLGFSQGACLASILCARQQASAAVATAAAPRRFRFAILVSGFVPADGKLAALFKGPPLELPVLVSHGKSDFMRERSQVERLAS